MNWDGHKEELKKGKAVEFRPKGNSMQPKINSGDQAVIRKMGEKDTDGNGGGYRFQIGNNKNHTNGTISQSQVFGKVTKVEP